MGIVEGEGIAPIYYNNEIIEKNNIENYILNETIHCISNKDNILISYPNPEFIIPFMAEAILKNEQENFRYRDDPSKRTTILVVSKNKKLISLLKNVYVSSHHVFEICKTQHNYLMKNNIFSNIDNPYYAKLYWRYILSKYYENEMPEIIPLNYILPIASGYHIFSQISRGDMNKIGRKDNAQNSVFLITSNTNLIHSNEVEYDYTFIDYTSINKNISNLPNGTLVFFDKPLDERISYYNKNKNVKNYLFGYEILEKFISTDKRNKSPFYHSILDMVSSTKVSNINIEYIKADFEDELEKALSLLMKLIYKKFDSYDLNLLRTLLYSIIKMPVEAVKYDNIAKFDPMYDTLNDLLRELKESDNRYEDDDFEEIIESIENIYNKYNLDISSPKYECLKNIIMSERVKGRTVGIILSNKVRTIALKEKLASTFGVEIENLGDIGVDFFNKKKIIDNQQSINSDTVVMLSALNVRDFNTLCNLEEKKTHILLYKIEINELVKKFIKLKDIKNLAIPLCGQEDVEYSENKNVYKYFYNKLRRHSTILDRSNIDNSLSISNMSDLIEADYNIPEKRILKEYTGENHAFAKLINLEDRGSIFIRKNSKIRYLNKSKKKVIIKKISEIKSGDEMVLIDNDSRKELFNVFINNKGILSQSANNYNKIEEWREKFEDKYVSLKYSDDELFKKLKELGWDKTTKSILRNWRSGYSFGPRDLKDIELLGRALNIESFYERAEEYHFAMASIRVERRVAARILNKIIYYSKRAINSEDLNFLSQYNLSYEDVKNAVKVRKVIDVSEKVYKVKPSEIGILFE